METDSGEGESLASEVAGSPASSRVETVSAAPSTPAGRTRLSGVWVSVIVGVVVFVFLLVFILQNTKSVKVSFLTVSGSMPLGVALLLAAIGGVLLAGLVASLRIWQLRHRLHKSNSGAADRPLA